MILILARCMIICRRRKYRTNRRLINGLIVLMMNYKVVKNLKKQLSLNNKKRIDPDRNFLNTEDLSEKSLVSQDELMTETLAKVLMKQKKYDKALEAYQILRLKYPEKNSFFANQIKKIQKLKE